MIDTSKRWQVIQGDCLEVLRELPDGCVDAVVTDPPYSSGGQFRADRVKPTAEKYLSGSSCAPSFSHDNKDQRTWMIWCERWMTESLRVLRSGGLALSFIDWRQLPAMTDVFQLSGVVWRGVFPWVKTNARPVPGGFSAMSEFAVWGTKGPTYVKDRYAKGVVVESAPRDRVHQTQKPVAALSHCIDVSAPGGLVLDPFAGSGTTGVACMNTGRRFIGIELDAGYCGIARERIAKAEADFLERENALIGETA